MFSPQPPYDIGLAIGDASVPASPRQISSPTPSLFVPLQDYHCAGRGTLCSSPTSHDPSWISSPRSSTASRFRRAGDTSLRQQTGGGSQTPRLVRPLPNDSDVRRVLKNLRVHAADQKSYLNSMTTQQLSHWQIMNSVTLCSGEIAKKNKNQAQLRSSRYKQPVPRTAERFKPVSTLQDLCEDMRLSCAAVEAAVQGASEATEQDGTDEAQSLLDEFGCMFQSRAGMGRPRSANSDASALSKNFSGDAHGGLTEEEMARLRQAAAGFRMSLDDVFLIKSVFDKFDYRHAGVVLAADFENTVTQLLHLQLRDMMISSSRVRKLCDQYWANWHPAAVTDTSEIAFDDFLSWYATALRANTLVTENERLRGIAEQWGMEPSSVEHLKRCFDAHHKSGCIDSDAFKMVLHKALRVPPHHELPTARLEQFFSTCDGNQSGLIAFEEFLCWWAKYFYGIMNCEDVTQGHQFTHHGNPPDGHVEQRSHSKQVRKAKLPFEDYYRRIRFPGAMTPDPPAYFHGQLVSALWQQIEDEDAESDMARSKDNVAALAHALEAVSVFSSEASEQNTQAYKRHSLDDSSRRIPAQRQMSDLTGAQKARKRCSFDESSVRAWQTLPELPELPFPESESFSRQVTDDSPRAWKTLSEKVRSRAASIRSQARKSL